MEKFNWVEHLGWDDSKIVGEITALKSANKSIFHTINWLQSFRLEQRLWTCRDAKENLVGYLIGGLRKKFQIRGLHIPPFTHCFYPILADSLSMKQKQEALNSLLPLLDKYGVVDFKFGNGCQEFLPFSWSGYQITTWVTYLLQGSYHDFMAQINKNKVREIKKLKNLVNSGAIIIDDRVDEHEFVKLFAETANRGGFSYKQLDLTGMYRNRMQFAHKLIGIRSKKHGLISIGLFPYDDKKVYNIINASKRVDDPVLKTINLLMLHEIIHFTLTSGRIFDFEGSMIKGVSEFYRLMGGEQVPVQRVTKSRDVRYSLLRALAQIKNDRKNA